MFRECITNPIEPISEEYARTLKRITNEPDYSLTCVGIAMLKSRIDSYQGIDGAYMSLGTKQDCVTDFIDRIKSVDGCPLFCYYRYAKEDCEKEAVAAQLSDFQEKKSISLFVENKMGFQCQVFYHEHMNAVGIFVNTADMRLYHVMLSFMSLYFPSLFADKPLTEDDYALIKSLSKKEKTDFFACIKKMTKDYSLEFRRVQLGSFMKQLHEAKIKNACNEVDLQRRQINTIERQLNDAVSALKNLIVIYEGMKATEQYDAPEEEMVEYIAENRSIHNLRFRNGNLYFSVSTLLNNYNTDAWTTFSNRGHIYDGNYDCRLTGAFANEKNRKILLDSIFSENPDLMIRMAGNYCLNFNNCSVSTDDCYDYVSADPMYTQYIPNPHLKRFACLGGYKDKVMRALRERNYIGAIELCIASAGSVNLDETTQTFRPFLGWVLTSNEKVLVTKDGKEFTPEEALVWLVDKEKE
ncbi:MAG: hypothetical protein J6Y78_15780 [Paludibacteraceae bacterium]|nr:hypothetical protein [Paludibacteraceae bacterium]